VAAAEPVQLVGASERMRSAGGRFPGRPGRPPKPAVSGVPVPVRHVRRHDHRRPGVELSAGAAITSSAPQDSTTNGPRLVDVATAAERLGVSPWTICELIERGALPRVELPGVRRVLVDVQDIERLVTVGKRGGRP
jgi:excisionase family DNA binding protein